MNMPVHCDITGEQLPEDKTMCLHCATLVAEKWGRKVRKLRRKYKAMKRKLHEARDQLGVMQ